MDTFGGCFLIIFPKKLISRSANITVLDGDNVLVVAEGEDNIDHSGISYAVLNIDIYVCVY